MISSAFIASESATVSVKLATLVAVLTRGTRKIFFRDTTRISAISGRSVEQAEQRSCVDSGGFGKRKKREEGRKEAKREHHNNMKETSE